MKKRLLCCILLPVNVLVSLAQASFGYVATEDSLSKNPRGVYKLMSVGSPAENKVKTSLDLYKICTDSVTLTLRNEGNSFVFECMDGNTIYNYTGIKQGLGDSRATHIYNSNAQHFTLRYWDSLKNPLWPSEGQWREENYESGQFSYFGKILFDAITMQGLKDNSNPFIGTWVPVGTTNDLQNGKECGFLIEESGKIKKGNSYCVVTPSHIITLEEGTGIIIPITIKDRNTLEIGLQTKKITWFSPDSIAIKLQDKYAIWIRYKEQSSLLDKFTTHSFSKMLADKRKEHLQEVQKNNEKWILTQRTARFLRKAYAKEFQNDAKEKGLKLTRKEAVKKSQAYLDECSVIMSPQQESMRSMELYEKLCKLNRLDSKPRLSDKDLRKIAFSSDLSQVPDFVMTRAKFVLYGKKSLTLWK